MAPRQGISSFGATVFVGAILAVLGLFFWRVWTYHSAITKGETAELPQFAGAFTSSGDAAATERPADLSASDDPSVGPEDAKLTVVEFLDYQCPFCMQAAATFREMATVYGDRVRFVTRDFPVADIHPEAVAAAEAAGCAQAQGKYWPMHDRLFALRGSLSRAELDRAAAQSGVDMAVFGACMDLDARLDEIQADLSAGVAAGVRGTPTFFFNGRPVEGVIPPAAFEALIKRFLES
jgi:protein-disulfide isomerase